MSPLVILVAQVFVVVLFTGLCLVCDRRSVPAGVGLIVLAFTLMPLLMVKALLDSPSAAAVAG